MPARRFSLPLGRMAAYGVALILFAFIAAPLFVLFMWSIAQQWFWPSILPTEFTLRWYRWAIETPNVLRALRTSLVVAVAVTLVTTIVATPAAFVLSRFRFAGRGAIRTIFSVPLLVPYISLGVGVASVFYTVGLTGSLVAVILAHMIAALPFGVLIISAAVDDLAPEIEEAGLACGAPPLTVFFRLTLPQLAPAMMAQAVYVFMLSMDEFTLTLLVSSPETATLPVQMYSAMGEGYLQISSALAMLLLAPSVLFSYVIARFLRTDLAHGA